MLTPSQHRKIANSINYFLLGLVWLSSWPIGVATSIMLAWIELRSWSTGLEQAPKLPQLDSDDDLAQRIEQAYATWQREEAQKQALKNLLENPSFINKYNQYHRYASGKTIVVRENHHA